MKTLRRNSILATAALLALAAAPAFAGGPLVYTGQGFTFDGTTWNLNDQRCGLDGQGIANDGSTGQFADWNGSGSPFQLGQPYLVWVLTAKGATSATLSGGPFGSGVPMYQVGGTYKRATPYYSPTETIGVVAATWVGGANKATLTVSHGCPPREGGWCSPGFWKNATDAAWALTGYSKADYFNLTVVPGYYDTPSNLDPTLNDVLTYTGPGGANHYGAAAPPFGLNAFNAVGAFLTGQLQGGFDPAKVGQEGTCQIDHFGNYVP